MPRVAKSRSATSINITRVDSPEALRRRAPAADSVLVMDLLKVRLSFTGVAASKEIIMSMH
jgi:hypothetical protein